jgi:PPP family 3-phenylpropionic acid transporter
LNLNVFSHYGRHTSLFYVALFMATGVHMPFWPLWLEDWGLTAAEVGFYTALGMGVRVVAGLVIPSLADRFDARRNTIAVATAIGILLFIGHLWIETKPVLLLATLAVGAVFAGVGPIAEALGVAAARVYDFPYAQTRALGSMGFLAANLIVGALIPVFGVGIALWWIVVCLVFVIFLVRRHPGGRRVKGQIPPNLREIGRLLIHPLFTLFVATVAFTQASHAVFYAFGSIHWRNLGLSEPVIGGLWAASVAAEIIFMFTIGAAVVQWLGPVRALVVSGLAGILRWGAMMTDPALVLLWPLQAMHALTFATGHLGAMAFISQAVPARYGAAAQGAMGSMAVGLLLALGMAVASVVYPALGGATYGIGAAFSGVGLMLAGILARRWKGQAIDV